MTGRGIRPELYRPYRLYESPERVGDGRPEFTSRFRWRAERRLRRLDAYRLVPFYRYEVVREGGRWAVVAFQNLAVPPGDKDAP